MSRTNTAWIDLEFPEIGRIRRPFFTDTASDVAKIEGTLLFLYDRGRYGLLREIRDGTKMLWPGDVNGKFTLDELVDSVGYSPPPDYFDKVYFVRDYDANLMKIGYSGNVKRRFASLCDANPHNLGLTLVLKGGKKRESELHAQFEAYRFKREWFRYEGELAMWVEDQLDNG